MRLLFTFILLFFSLNAFSQKQKVKVKKDIVKLNGDALFKMVSTKYPDAYTIYNLDDEKLALFNANYYRDEQQVTAGNPEGRVAYFVITFFNDELDQCEIRIVGFKKHLAKRIINEKIDC